MGERRLIVDRLKLQYEGLFNVDEFYRVLSGWFFDKEWDWHEKMNEELVRPQGKQIRLELRPWKSVSDYYKIQMKIKVIMMDVREVEIEHKGELLRMHHGVVKVLLSGYVMSDRFGQWTSTPLRWFLSIIFENYFFKKHYEKFEAWCQSDVEDLYQKLKNYLNVFNYTYRQR